MCRTKGDENNPLNVHHRYYIYRRYAWNYDNSSLITLCSRCHALVHKTIAPLIYAENQNRLVVMNFTPCYRCNGAGYFPEYKKIESGVCFRCRGAKYEELINNKSIVEDCYYSDEYVFDVLRQTYTNFQINEAFQDALSFHVGEKSSLTTTTEAVNRYYLAATNGLAQAQNNLGVIYKDGYGAISKNLNIATRWFVYSAMQGKYIAQRHLAHMYEFGIGVNKNIYISIMWERLTWHRCDNHASHYAIRRVRDKSLDKRIRNVYYKRVLELAKQDNPIAKDFVVWLDKILKTNNH